jgi:hypothetical protein
MPQPRSGGSRSSSGGSSQSRSGTTRRSSSGASSGGRGAGSGGRSASSSGRSASSGGRGGSRSTSSARSKTQSSGADAQFEAVAQRLRKLNERIITAGKDAGETTLTNYEKALKAIASAVERGPGSSEVEWVSNLANAQAKFIRDVTNTWTSAARDMLK